MKNIIKINCIIIALFAGTNLFAQAFGVFPRILSVPVANSASQHKVKDVQSENCNLESGCNYLYPVFFEDFGFPSDLPNKWRFDLGYTFTDDVSGTAGANTWLGDAVTTNTSVAVPLNSDNYSFNSGIMTMSFKERNVIRNNDGNIENFKFTSGMINSLSKFRTGVFEARIKVPSANKMFPAYWLLNSKDSYGEVDIFEYFDPEVSSNNCNTYDLHRMSVHTGQTNNNYHRSDKYPQDIDQWHTYKLVWNEYETIFFVDGSLKGYATKHFRSITPPGYGCRYGTSDHPLDPLINAGCEALNLMPDNLLPSIPYIDWGARPWWLPSNISWPPPQPPQPYLANYISRHDYFPHKNNAMSVIINNFAYPAYKQDNFSGFAQSELDMQVDWVKVSQPFCCGVDKTVCSLNDLDNQTYFTDILTGRKLTIGNTGSSCNFAQNLPRLADYRDIPVVLLATEEIAINSEAIFPGGTYAEMQIVNCGSSSRLSSEEESQLNNYQETQNALLDSIADADQPIYDSIANAYVEHYIDSINREYSQYQPGHRKHMGQEETNVINIGYAYDDVSISPNPSADVINIKSSDWLFDKIKLIYVLDVNGREIELKKARTININELAKGSYILKIVMDDGTLLKKKLIKL
jgi:hypothetical protein